MDHVATYVYTNEQEKPLYEVLRYEEVIDGKKKKTFRQRHFDESGSPKWGLLDTTRRPLYRLGNVLGSTEVFWVEGERDVATIEALGLCGTTASGGANSTWQDEWATTLAGKTVYVIPDNDEAGRKRSKEIINRLEQSVRAVYLVELPEDSKDITEFFEKGHTTEEFNKLIESARNKPITRLKALVRQKGSPAAKESERLILGSLMAGKCAFSDVSELSQEHFYYKANKIIFGVLASLTQLADPLDTHSVIQSLEALEKLEEVGGMLYVVDLVEDLPSVFNLDAHIEILIKKAASRDLLGSLIKSAEDLIVGADPKDTKDRLSEIQIHSSDKNDLPTSSVSDIVGPSLDAFLAPKVMGIDCKPIHSVMQACYGFHPGQLVIVAGRPGAGKSSISSILAAYAAKDGHETEVISLEVSKEEALLKIACAIARVPYLSVYSGNLEPFQRKAIAQAIGKLADMPLRIDDSSTWTVGKIKNHIKKRFNAGNPIRILILDYLQLMQTSGGKKRHEEIADITRSLKLLAKEFGLTIVLLSQLNREMEKDNREPKLSDLRESGSIEQDADIVWLIHRDMASEEIEVDAWINMAKQRNGPTLKQRVRFSRPFAFFYEPKHIDPPNYSKLLPGYGLTS